MDRVSRDFVLGSRSSVSLTRIKLILKMNISDTDMEVHSLSLSFMYSNRFTLVRITGNHESMLKYTKHPVDFNTV